MAGNKLTKEETDGRIRECYRRRFEDPKPFGVKMWIDYCHQMYGDKSEQQYTAYWMSAGELYDEGWRARLKNLLDPAVNELTRALASEDEKIRTRAIDQVMKYNGEDIQKIQAEIQGDIKISFGDEG